MMPRWLRTVEAHGEPGRVSLQECGGAIDAPVIIREMIMTADVGSHIGFELARLSVAVLKQERSGK